jgi:ACS family hexuronate transporter-like MFS transporter
MASAKIKNYRWIIVGLLFTGTVINYLDRQIIGLLKPTLEAEFSWTESDFGKIMSAFSFAYAIGLLVSGRFIDKVGTKMGYSVAVVVWSLAGMFHALAKSVMGFGIARLSLGIGEAGNFPAAMKAVAEWFPKKERALATGSCCIDSCSNYYAKLWLAGSFLDYRSPWFCLVDILVVFL